MELDVEQKYPHAFYGCRPQHALWDDFSLRHPKMPLEKRAKIFSPFAALKGFEEAIESKLRPYAEKRELNEEEQARLDAALSRLYALTYSRRMVRQNPVNASVTYYVPCQDENSEAYGCRGSYETVSGVVQKVDPLLTRTLAVANRTIDFSDLCEITISEES